MIIKLYNGRVKLLYGPVSGPDAPHIMERIGPEHRHDRELRSIKNNFKPDRRMFRHGVESKAGVWCR